MKEFLTACRRGAKVSWHFGILPLQIVLAIFSAVSLLTAPWTLTTIDNLFWKYFIQALAFCVLFVTLLSIGLMPYFGQKEVTKDCEQEKDRYEKWKWEARSERDNFEQEIAQLKQKH
ncbi:hypothetical protein ACFLVN_04520 [Chloroflexota bacterium]